MHWGLQVDLFFGFFFFFFFFLPPPPQDGALLNATGGRFSASDVLCGLRLNITNLRKVLSKTSSSSSSACDSSSRCKFSWSHGCMEGETGFCCLDQVGSNLLSLYSREELLGVMGMAYDLLLDRVDVSTIVAFRDAVGEITNNTLSLQDFNIKICSPSEAIRKFEVDAVARSIWEERRRRKHKHKVLGPVR